MSALCPQADISKIGGLRQRDDLIDVLFAGGVQRGTHILKAISLGGKGGPTRGKIDCALAEIVLVSSATTIV
jgi:hypothetical protein